MTTLSDVARLASVSTMTVSNVLSGRKGRVSEATAKRVWKAVERVGYVPNSAARALSGRRSHLIAIVLNVEGDALRSVHDALFIGALTQDIQQRGYYALLQTARNLRETAAGLQTWSVDAACFVKTGAHEVDQLRDAYDIPMLFPDNYSDSPDVLTVRINDFEGGRIAAEYFLKRGHRHACFIGPGAERQVGLVAERRRGFSDVFAQAGLPLPPAPPGIPSPLIGSGTDAAALVLSLSPRPSAVFCSSDELAAGLIRGLTRAGIRVPEDISIIGFDGFDIGEITTPELTTIAQDVEAKARRSVDLLLRALEDPQNHPRTSTMDLDPLPVRLVERQSVGDVSS